MFSIRYASASFLICAALFLCPGAFAQAEEGAAKGWAGKVSLGGSLTAGNSDALKGSFDATGAKSWGPHLLRLAMLASYGKSNGNVDSDKQSLDQYYRYSFTDRFYAYVDLLEGRDSVQDINFRFLGNVGPGWRVFKTGEFEFLDVEIGAGFRHETYKGPSRQHPVGPFARNDGTGRAAFLYADLIGPAKFTQSGEYLLPFNDTGAWLATAKTTLSLPLAGAWSFNNTLLLEWLNRPAGTNEELDLEYVVSLGYEF